MIGTGQNLAEDSENGFFNRLQLTPIRAPALVAGQLAGTLVLGLFQAATYIGIGLAAGATIEAGIAGALVLVALSVVITLAFGSIGLFAGMRASSAEAVQGLFPLIFVFLFLSSMSLPRDLIETDWFQTVATYNPVSYMIEGIRSLLIIGWDAEALALGFGSAIVILIAGIAATSYSLKERMGADMRRYLSVATGMASRLLRKLSHEPGAVPAADADADLLLRRLRGRALGRHRGARLRLPGRLHRLRVRLRAAPDRGLRRGLHRLLDRRRLPDRASAVG